MTGEYLSTNRIDLRQPTTLFMVASVLCVVGLGISFYNTTAGIHAFGYSFVFIAAGMIVMLRSTGDEQADLYDQPEPPKPTNNE